MSTPSLLSPPELERRLRAITDDETLSPSDRRAAAELARRYVSEGGMARMCVEAGLYSTSQVAQALRTSSSTASKWVVGAIGMPSPRAFVLLAHRLEPQRLKQPGTEAKRRTA